MPPQVAHEMALGMRTSSEYTVEQDWPLFNFCRPERKADCFPERVCIPMEDDSDETPLTVEANVRPALKGQYTGHQADTVDKTLEMENEATMLFTTSLPAVMIRNDPSGTGGSEEWKPDAQAKSAAGACMLNEINCEAICAEGATGGCSTPPAVAGQFQQGTERAAQEENPKPPVLLEDANVDHAAKEVLKASGNASKEPGVKSGPPIEALLGAPDIPSSSSAFQTRPGRMFLSTPVFTPLKAPHAYPFGEVDRVRPPITSTIPSTPHSRETTLSVTGSAPVFVSEEQRLSKESKEVPKDVVGLVPLEKKAQMSLLETSLALAAATAALGGAEDDDLLGDLVNSASASNEETGPADATSKGVNRSSSSNGLFNVGQGISKPWPGPQTPFGAKRLSGIDVHKPPQSGSPVASMIASAPSPASGPRQVSPARPHSGSDGGLQASAMIASRAAGEQEMDPERARVIRILRAKPDYIRMPIYRRQRWL